MREILFRGKRISDGKWLYGLYSDERVHETDFPCIFPLLEMDDDDDWAVLPDTVGQYTSLTDKNGKKIFEGDIIHISGNTNIEDWKDVDYNALIVFKNGGFCAIDGTEENHGFRRYDLSRCDFTIEIIGNIYDNSDLLKV